MGKQKMRDLERKERGKEGKDGKKKGKPEVNIEKKKVDYAQIVRLAETNVDGRLPVHAAMRRIKGIGFMMSNAISKDLEFSNKKLGDLSEQEIKQLEGMIMESERLNIPKWLYNRRRDPISGQDKHLAVSKLDLTNRMDINEMRKLKSYKGIRHSSGLPVRGQRTRSSFRKSGKAVGVSKKKQAPGKKK